MKRIATLFLLIALSAQGGVQSVGKGGGYAEMQALWINLSLRDLANGCTRSTSNCGLSANEVEQVARAAEGSFNLKINDACTISKIRRLDADTAMVSACDLYSNVDRNSTPVARSLAQIATIVLTARLVAREAMEEIQAGRLAATVFQAFQQSENRILAGLDHGALTVRYLEARRDRQTVQLLAIEGEKKTLEIADQLPAALACRDSSVARWQLVFNSAINLGSENGTDSALIEADLLYSCAGENHAWRATLKIFFSSQKGELLPESVRLRTAEKRSVHASEWL